MSRTVAVATSPLNCRWIEPGSRRAIEAFEYAVCRRTEGAVRVVNEAECRYCPAWEPPPHGGVDGHEAVYAAIASRS